MPDFTPVIDDAYLEILGRRPDAQGLAYYDREMRSGLSEADMRESLLRSAEYAEKNPGFGFADRLGINVHIPSDDILRDVSDRLGFEWIRVDFDWFRIEPDEGRFDWRDTDRVVETAWSRGLEILATIAYTPSWASSRPGAPTIADPPASPALWTGFVREAVRRYRNRIRYWQLWNEPNLTEFWNGTKEAYRTEILEAGARAAKEQRPDARVVGPGLANVGSWRDWFEEAMKSKSILDVIDHHNYASTGRASIVELRTDGLLRPSLQTLMRRNGVDDRPFWLTETGRRFGEGDQAQYFQQLIATLRVETWVSRLFVFHYWDGPGQGNDGFGIVNEDRSPKPAYFVLQSALHAPASFALDLLSA